MKKITFMFFLVFISQIAFSQTGNKAISYSGTAYTTEGVFVTEKIITLEVSIIKETPDGELIYREIHYPQTNAFGFFAIEIGRGLPTADALYNNFSFINWMQGPYFLKTRIDFGQEGFLNGLADMGTIELLSVPYSFVAQNAVYADSLSLPISLSFTQLADVNINSPADKQFVAWDALSQKWITADPTGDQGVFLRTDGTSDLTGNWTISSNNISLTDGNLSLTNGQISTPGIILSQGVYINEFSNDLSLADSSNLALPTEMAVKTYVDNTFLNGPWSMAGNYIVAQIDKNIGIGTLTPSHKLHVNMAAGEGILFEGIFGVNIPDLGQGTRMSFYPGKSAFRAGRIFNNTDFWNNANVGNYSAAFGYDTKASGTASFAAGENNIAASTGSASFGRNNSSNSLYSFSSGYGNTITGIASVVSAYESTSHGDYTAVFGKQNRAGNTVGVGGDYSLIYGELSTAEGNHSLSGGYMSSAKADYSFTGGYNSQSNLNAIASFVYGYNNSASGYYSFSSGNNTIAYSFSETAIGNFNYSFAGSNSAWNSSDALFVIGNGSDASSRNNAITILKNSYTGIGLGQNKPQYLLEVGVNGDGSVAVANSWQNFSDLRLKKDLQKIDSPMQKLLQLNGYYFYWINSKDTTRQVGIIAQEAESVFPEIVGHDGKKYKTVNYSGLNPLIIEAVKEQNQYIINLQNENKVLKEENRLLRIKVEENSDKIKNIEEYIKASSLINIIK